MELPKISVIIPVYNVEPYLRRCLDSVVNQTYQNLEIILVDDGSPDNCGAICDEYAARDKRIRVIHQENQGVSAARNSGLSVAMGEWIGWVDSDDWIEPDMYEYLMNGVQLWRADIAICGRIEHYVNKSVSRSSEKVMLLDCEQAMELLLKNDLVQNYLWDKLWRRDLFDDIRFPVGQTFEDIAVMHSLFHKAKSVLWLPEGKYNYFQRAGSIVDDVSLKNRINHYIAAKKRFDEMEDKWPQFRQLLEAQCIASSVMIWCAYYKNPKLERVRYWAVIQSISNFAREHRQSAIAYMNLGITGRTVVRLIPYPKWWAFRLASFCSWLYKQKHGRLL